MPTLNRKRRAPEADDQSEGSEGQAEQQSRRKRVSRSPESEKDVEGDGLTQGNATTVEQMAKKVVRLALAHEYSRKPLRRADINLKVFGGKSKQFKEVFDEAQLTLRDTFGMEMVELPIREKVTLQARRAAQKQEKAATASKVFVLVSTLPDKYRGPDIICPPQIPSTETESAYTGLVSFIVVNIYLAGGALPEAKLDRYLQRANAEHSTPVDKTDKLLNRLISEGYINRIKDNSSGEEVVEYMVGPRGRVEIGEEGVMRLVQTVYGEDAPDDLEQRLSRSLGLGEKHGTQAASNGNAANGANGVSKKGKRRSTKNQEEEADEEEEDEQSDEEDEEQ